MDRNVSEMNNEEIEEEIQRLEESYAHILGTTFDHQHLFRIWNRIRELRTELEARKQNLN